MALIIEDGSNVPNADSYVSEAAATVIAAKLGLTLRDSEIPLRLAAVYLEKARNRYQGSKVFDDQSLQWPRDPVYIDKIYNEPGVIPEDLIYAQVAVASAISTGSDVFGSSLGNIASKSVGDVSVSYANNGSTTNAAYLGLVQEYLAPLFKNPENGALEFAVSRA
jgi:hypothetical protein